MSETKTVRKANAILYVTLLFWVCILAWANFAVLEEVTRGQGRVMASSRIQIIQNLEGGIIKDIVVKPGDLVSSGDPLVYLETTLIKLTAGLYQPIQGQLTFNRMPTDQIDNDTFRQKLAVVLQDFQLFSGTLKDNILMGREWIGDDALKEALECSGVQRFLSTIPGGLQAVLADRGQSLST